VPDSVTRCQSLARGPKRLVRFASSATSAGSAWSLRPPLNGPKIRFLSQRPLRHPVPQPISPLDNSEIAMFEFKSLESRRKRGFQHRPAALGGAKADHPLQSMMGANSESPASGGLSSPPREHRGKPFAVGRRELCQFGSEPGEWVALVDPFAFVTVPGFEGVSGLRQRAERSGFEGVGVCVFRFAGANPGANRKRRRRKCLPVLTCVMRPVARQAGGRRFEPSTAHITKPFVAMSYERPFLCRSCKSRPV